MILFPFSLTLTFQFIFQEMNKTLLLLSIPLLGFSQNMSEPKAKVEQKTLTIHNHTRTDDYYWMNKRDSKPVLDYIHEENKLSENFFKSQDNTVQKLLKEFESRIDPNIKSAPFVMNHKMYQSQMVEGKDYSLTYALSDKGNTLFFDENERAKGQKFYELADFDNSPDNKILAIAEDFKGRRNYSITFRINETGKFLSDEIKNTSGDFVWAQDNKTIYYTVIDKQSLRTYRLYKHVLGTPSSKDELIFEEKDELFDVYLSQPNTYTTIQVVSSSTTTTKVYELPADGTGSNPVLFMPTIEGHRYSVLPHPNGYYILSNHLAPNNQLVFSKEKPKSIEACQVILAHDKNVLLEDVTINENFIVQQLRSNGLDKIGIYNIKDKSLSYIKMEEETYSLTVEEFNYLTDTEIYYNYTSLTTPPTLFKYNLLSNTKSESFKITVLDPTFSSDNYKSERIWFVANDGTKIPASIVYKKGTDLKNAPCLLYGYGSYGITLSDQFRFSLLSLLDRGFVYVQAHVRGEKYMGESWYQDGKFLKKKNTFTDFINVSEQLSQRGYCHPEKLYIQGGSAGGLLMGAVMNMAPYLYKGVIAQVPFVDVVNTMLDETIPLTVGEFEEWGNPKEEDYYWYMLSYSPYDNTHKMAYPNLLITTGYHDSQVQYWEPLKWIAKIRTVRTNKNLLLLDCNMDAGHGGGSGRSNERLEIAKEFAFILSLEKLD